MEKKVIVIEFIKFWGVERKIVVIEIIGELLRDGGECFGNCGSSRT